MITPLAYQLKSMLSVAMVYWMMPDNWLKIIFKKTEQI